MESMHTFRMESPKKRIWDLQEASCTSILDAKMRWSRAITTELWPYALRHCNYAHMQTPHRSGKHGGRSPLEIFLEAQVQPNVKHFHPYDVLFTFYTKTWLPRSRCGIYFGFSPNHSRSVALILNPQTGLVSPQFHVKFDDLFETTDYPQNTQLDPAEWQHKTGFKSKKFG